MRHRYLLIRATLRFHCYGLIDWLQWQSARLSDFIRFRALALVTAYDTVRYWLGMTDAIRYWRSLPTDWDKDLQR